jgi:hypothetical protein
MWRCSSGCSPGCRQRRSAWGRLELGRKAWGDMGCRKRAAGTTPPRTRIPRTCIHPAPPCSLNAYRSLTALYLSTLSPSQHHRPLGMHAGAGADVAVVRRRDAGRRDRARGAAEPGVTARCMHAHTHTLHACACARAAGRVRVRAWCVCACVRACTRACVRRPRNHKRASTQGYIASSASQEGEPVVCRF